jgi:hypothetical protein
MRSEAARLPLSVESRPRNSLCLFGRRPREESEGLCDRLPSTCGHQRAGNSGVGQAISVSAPPRRQLLHTSVDPTRCREAASRKGGTGPAGRHPPRASTCLPSRPIVPRRRVQPCPTLHLPRHPSPLPRSDPLRTPNPHHPSPPRLPCFRATARRTRTSPRDLAPTSARLRRARRLSTDLTSTLSMTHLAPHRSLVVRNRPSQRLLNAPRRPSSRGPPPATPTTSRMAIGATGRLPTRPTDRHSIRTSRLNHANSNSPLLRAISGRTVPDSGFLPFLSSRLVYLSSSLIS